MTVATYDPEQQLADEMAGLWRHASENIRWQSRVDSRLDRMQGDIKELKTDVSVLKTDVAELKGDVSVLKTDMAETKERVSRLEISQKRGFDRMDAQFERLFGLIRKDELTR